MPGQASGKLCEAGRVARYTVPSPRPHSAAEARVVGIVVVSAGDQLRQPGGPAGEQEYRHVAGVRLVSVPARPPRGVRGLGGLGVGLRAERGEVLVTFVNDLAGHQDVPQGGRAGPQALGHVLVVEVAQHIGNGQGPGLAVLA